MSSLIASLARSLLPRALSPSAWWRQAPLTAALIAQQRPKRVLLLGCNDPGPAAHLRELLAAVDPTSSLLDLAQPTQAPSGLEPVDLCLLCSDSGDLSWPLWRQVLAKDGLALTDPDIVQLPELHAVKGLPGLHLASETEPAWLQTLRPQWADLKTAGDRLQQLALWSAGLQRPALAIPQEALQQQLDDTLLKLQAIEDSRLWRLSTPLRDLAGKARRWQHLGRSAGLPAGAASARLEIRRGRQPLRTDRPTLLLLTHESSATGAPILAWNIAQSFSATHNVVVLSLRAGLLDEAWLDVSGVLATKPLSQPPCQGVLEELLSALPRHAQPNFCIVNTIQGWAWLEWLRRLNIASVLLVHEFPAYVRPRHAFQAALIWATDVVFSSTATWSDLQKRFPDLRTRAVRILPQGRCALPGSLEKASEPADPEEWSDLPALQIHHSQTWLKQSVLVMGAGAVQPRKGVDLFVAAAQRLRQRLPDQPLLFLWMGDGYDPELDYSASLWIADQIERSGLADCLHILPANAAYNSCLRRADLFWLTSRLDPMPNVAIDALLCGTTVMCFAQASGTASWLEEDPELAQSCVAPYLDIDQLAALSEPLILNPKQRHYLSRRAQQRAAIAFRMQDYVQQLAVWGQRAEQLLRQQEGERTLLHTSSEFDPSFFLSPDIDPGDDPLLPYLMAWASRVHERKPKPGFHPGIFAAAHGIAKKKEDPFAAFIRQGQPDGPWCTPVIEPNPNALQHTKPVGLHLHVHYAELLPELLERVALNQTQPELWISISGTANKAIIQQHLERSSLVCQELLACPNRGRDLGPLLVEIGRELDQRYEFHGHLHTKKSVLVESNFADRWRHFLLSNLLGDGQLRMLDSIVAAMESNPQLGLVFPDDPNCVGWGDNRDAAETVLASLGLSATLPAGLNFPVGSMFWARRGALSNLYQHLWRYEDFPAEPIGYDGTILHAIERLLGAIPWSTGFTTGVTHVPGLSR